MLERLWLVLSVIWVSLIWYASPPHMDYNTRLTMAGYAIYPPAGLFVLGAAVRFVLFGSFRKK